jgi:hypothetical protein
MSNVCFFLVDDIEVDRIHHVNRHVRNIVIVRVVHVNEMNTDEVKTMMGNIAVNIDDVERTYIFPSPFFDISERSKYLIW